MKQGKYTVADGIAHPAGEIGRKRICPVTNRQFRHAWSDHGLARCYNKCDSCYPDEAISVGERLRRLNQQRKENQD